MDTELGRCLPGILNPDANIRIRSELRIGELLPHPDAGLILSSILMSTVDISIRQMSTSRKWLNHSAGIILRMYVKEHWSPYFGTFKGTSPSPEIKSNIRSTVFQALSDPSSKVRSAAANVLSLIASSDWPDEYPNLLNDLLRLLLSQSTDAVHGSMQVFIEFIKDDLTEDQLLPILQELLPILMAILGDINQHSVATRAHSIAVFRHCLSALYMVKDQYPEAIKEAVGSMLPQWIGVFRVLTSPDAAMELQSWNNWDPLLLRIQVFKTLNNIQTMFSRVFKDSVQIFLSISLNHLQSLLPTFIKCYLDQNATPPVSSEGDEISLPRLSCSIIDFISNIARTTAARSWFDHTHLEQLINVVFHWIQMTGEDEEAWRSNANLFAAHEDDETQEYNLRVVGLDLISELLDRYATNTVVALQAATQRLVQEANQAREQGSQEWWRPLEAALAALGSQAEAVSDLTADQAKSLQVESLLLNVVPSLLTASEYPFLQGRCFVFASQYCKVLPASIASQYLEAALAVIEASEPGVPVKVSAVKAIRNFCTRMDNSTVIPVAPRIVKDLGPFLLATTEDTLALVLEAINAVLEIGDGEWLDPELARMLSEAALEVWTRNIKDPITLSILDDLISNLACSPAPGVRETVVSQSLPVLSQTIGQSGRDESWSSAIDLIASLVRGSSRGKLGEGFFAAFAPNLFSCLQETQDQETLENAVVLLTYVVRKDPAQLLSWADEQGQSGLTRVLALIARLLAPSDSESGGLVLGDLIIHILRNAGEAVLPVLPDLIRVMTNRMNSAKMTTLIQSLIIPLAYLIHTHRDSVLSVLESFYVDGTDVPKTGLEVFISTWTENAETIQGLWSQRASILAFCSLLLSGRPSLQNILVKGDMIIKPETSNVIVTRSRAKKTPHDFQWIPFPVKALKILLEELHINGEVATLASRVGDVPSDDGDSEWADSDNEEKLIQGFKSDEFAYLSEILAGKGGSLDDEHGIEEGLDDEDLKQDAIYTMDIQAHLITFLRQFAQQDPTKFHSLVDELNAEEIVEIQNAINGN